MESYLGAFGYYVWDSVISGNISTNESRRYNIKENNVILSALLDFVKTKVGQCSSAKNIWEKLQNIYLKKHVDQGEDEYDDHDLDRALFMGLDTQNNESNDDEEEEVEVDMEGELVSALSDLKQIRKENKILEEKFAQNQKELDTTLAKVNRFKE